jgi:hypothetical protein
MHRCAVVGTLFPVLLAACARMATAEAVPPPRAPHRSA